MPYALDTDSATQAQWDALWARATPTERLAAASRQSRQVRALTWAGVQAQYPDLSELGQRYYFLARLYGAEIAARVVPCPH